MYVRVREFVGNIVLVLSVPLQTLWFQLFICKNYLLLHLLYLRSDNITIGSVNASQPLYLFPINVLFTAQM